MFQYLITCSPLHDSEDWIKELDPNATVPQHTFTVVAHNTPAGAWATGTDVATAIKDIEDANINLGVEFSIANLCWLNSDCSRATSGSGPLMISFKN